jgi:Sec-independent protein translocase protein TatA
MEYIVLMVAAFFLIAGIAVFVLGLGKLKQLFKGEGKPMKEKRNVGLQPIEGEREGISPEIITAITAAVAAAAGKKGEQLIISVVKPVERENLWGLAGRYGIMEGRSVHYLARRK